MTDEERIAFRKAYKDMKKFAKPYVYRPPPLAMGGGRGGGSNKSPRTAATVPAQAEVPDALPVTETDGDGFGVVA